MAIFPVFLVTDPLIDCKECKTRHRADKLIEEWAHEHGKDMIADGMSDQELIDFINENKIPCHPILVRRKVAEQKALDKGFISSGDVQFINYPYPWVIYNDGSIEDFINETKQLMEKVSA